MTDDTQDTPGTTPAGEAREGLLDGWKGKAKEVVGAVTGKDDLVEEGRLQQAEAQQRKTAATDEAVAGARRDEAARQLSETSQEAAAEKEAVHESADAAQRAVDRERAREESAADRTAARQEASQTREAEQRAREIVETRAQEAQSLEADAAATENQAVADQVRLQHEADAAEQRAALLRHQNTTEG